MAIYLTNGRFYITHSKSGAVIKVNSVEEAQDFHTVEKALMQKKKAPGKTCGFYYIDTEKQSRKDLSPTERLQIYRKTEGHCYLCGEFVDYDKFEVEHRIPLAGGGTNDVDNLFCSCHICNTLKGSIAPQDFLKKVRQIYLYQLDGEYKHSAKDKIIYKVLKKLL